MASLLDEPHVDQVLNVIWEDFATLDSIGPMRAAEFLVNGPDYDIQVDTAGLAGRLLTLLG